ncbi:MAG: hypothetical protein JW915_00300 [Chitinispirillaceae bacterium]|nr:hypothetical protein [Chitinispirillaceae bacterium]
MKRKSRRGKRTIKNLKHTVEKRLQLERIALTDTDQHILQVNAAVADIAHCDDFYYDPHTKHNTGMHKLLKGWCSAFRWADKTLHSDFIHTKEGMPVYMYHSDNYQGHGAGAEKILLSIDYSFLNMYLNKRRIYKYVNYQVIF